MLLAVTRRVSSLVALLLVAAAGLSIFVAVAFVLKHAFVVATYGAPAELPGDRSSALVQPDAASVSQSPGTSAARLTSDHLEAAAPTNESSDGKHAGSNVAPSEPSRASRADSKTILRVGDRMTLAFYEKLEIDDEQKWAARFQGRHPAQSFHLRSELSGVYEVQENGQIVLPLLGSFRIAGRTPAHLEQEVAVEFEKIIGRFAFLSAKIEHRPVYLLGPVDKPGVYPFSSGMTAYHLLALAGGIDRRSVSVERVLSSIDQVERKQKLSTQLQQVLARLCVMLGERDGHEPRALDQLLHLAGDEKANTLISAELAVRKPQTEAREQQDAALAKAGIATAEQLEHLRVRRKHIEESIALRQGRVDDLQRIDRSNNRSLIMSAATELTDAKERLAEADIAIKQAEMKMSDLEKDRAAIRNTHRIDVEREIQAATNLANELTIALAAGQSAEMVTNDLVESVGRGDSDLQFEIVRQSQGSSIVMAVSGTEPLQPGDLIRVKRFGSGSTSAPAAPGSDNQSRERPPDPAGL